MYVHTTYMCRLCWENFHFNSLSCILYSIGALYFYFPLKYVFLLLLFIIIMLWFCCCTEYHNIDMVGGGGIKYLTPRNVKNNKHAAWWWWRYCWRKQIFFLLKKSFFIIKKIHDIEIVFKVEAILRNISIELNRNFYYPIRFLLKDIVILACNTAPTTNVSFTGCEFFLLMNIKRNVHFKV